MQIPSIRKTIAGVALASAVFVGVSAPAHAVNLSWGFTSTGSIVLNTGDITATTTLKTLPGINQVNTINPPDAAKATLAGIALLGSVTLSSLAIPIGVGPITPLVISAGLLTYTFTNQVLATRVATGALSAGSLSIQINGTITGDTSAGSTFLGQSASMSESCTQVSIGAAINCSDTLSTPALPVPEPATMALLGVGLLGMAAVRRRMS